jgi:FKBP-type peptidyl-prolyl cis-trans isomerase FklB
MNSTKEKVSYCIGLETGKRLKHQFGDMDLERLKQGFLDGSFNSPQALPQEEVQSILAHLQSQVEIQQKAQLAQLSDSNKKQSEMFLQSNKQQEGVVTLSSGLQYKILTSGPESGAHPSILDAVKIHYRGSFIDGRVFDSSFQRNQPATFPLNRVIPGWTEVLQLMRVGDKWQVFIPSYLAYGEAGFGPEIGPNTALIFEMELLAINEK